MKIAPLSLSERSNSLISRKARFHSSSEQNASTLSTRTLPYQERSKMAISPLAGSLFQNLHM